MAAVWKLERDTKAWLEALPGGREGEVPACTAGDGHLDQPARRARLRTRRRRSRGGYADQPTAADALSPRSRAKRLLFMRRVLPDPVLDRMVMRTVGLRTA
jgi:hypothetical protein